LQQPAAKLEKSGLSAIELIQLPWSHHQVLLDRVKDNGSRVYYIRESIKNGWSRNILIQQISGKLLERKGKAVTNFNLTLPKPQSNLAQETLKNPYLFDFLNLSIEAKEQ
jgi:predicted nuclease of restriction endonuclease-like (RecB) superfamily